tara:strand:- start:387 stop:785 length:399 start_codon:yes stop_codon:yes gene_type:complete
MTYLEKSNISEKMKYETLVDTNGFVLGTCDILPGSDFKIHTHKVSETYIITYGNGEVYNNNQWEPVSKGDIRVFHSGIWHCCRTFNKEGISLVYFFNTGPFNTIEYIYPKNPGATSGAESASEPASETKSKM